MKNMIRMVRTIVNNICGIVEDREGPQRTHNHLAGMRLSQRAKERHPVKDCILGGGEVKPMKTAAPEAMHLLHTEATVAQEGGIRDWGP